VPRETNSLSHCQGGADELTFLSCTLFLSIVVGFRLLGHARGRGRGGLRADQEHVPVLFGHPEHSFKAQKWCLLPAPARLLVREHASFN
jgi:hypothetical protein